MMAKNVIEFIRPSSHGPDPKGVGGDHGRKRSVGQGNTQDAHQHALDPRQIHHFSQQFHHQQVQNNQAPNGSQPQKPITRNQQLAEQAKLPVPRSTGRQAVSQPPPTSNIPISNQAYGLPHPNQRTRANSSDGLRGPQQQPVRTGDLWENSTISSRLTSELEQLLENPRAHRGLSLDTRVPTGPPLRPLPTQPERRPQPTAAHAPDYPPFVIGDSGHLKVLDRQQGSAAPTANVKIQQKTHFPERRPLDEEAYLDKSDLELTPKKQPALKHSKLTFRDGRDGAGDLQDTARRLSYVERPGYSGATNGLNRSPERYDKTREGTNGSRHERQTRNSDPHRSTQFFDIDTPQPTPAPDDDISDLASQGDEATVTHRTTRPGTLSTSPVKGFVNGPPPKSIVQAASRVNPVQLPHNSREKLVAPTRKRPRSPDYDDSVLHKMSYSELTNEPFDHDPARAALKPGKALPSGDSLVDKLLHYQDQDEKSQHEFFTQMSIDEWDDSGDWFLEEFSKIVLKIKTARREKREVVNKFEEELSAREEAVRNKTEKIEKTMENLHKEGIAMMRGKEVNE